ncbi:hypothetical protein SAMN05660690_4318 [Geodermatophilus telluris]|uniref:Uncharacterized protein n=1 Tax=Geodermatophilus telluris TaxID=1190417 RepID=A0A1G6V4K3_9ACTN|nr:hypothetical protein [Geodermatophilus telluris]SDD47917.1 hypothetical protein SAMN05660690_4318 [Geodermatophilus telluris]
MDDDGAGGPAGKLTARVAERLAQAGAGSPVEVVVELRPVEVPVTGSRAERTRAVRAAFERELAGVAERIAAAGGVVLETAWVDQTVRGSVPAAGLLAVAEDDAVTAIDLPRPLQPDAGAS